MKTANAANPLNNSSAILLKHYSSLTDIIGETVVPPHFPQEDLQSHSMVFVDAFEKIFKDIC